MEQLTMRVPGVVHCASKLKRKILAETQDYITTFQTFNKGTIDLDYHYFYAYLQPELSEYDAWFNVKDNLLVLGVSVKDPSKIAGYYARFLAYMKELHGLRIDEETLKTYMERQWGFVAGMADTFAEMKLK